MPVRRLKDDIVLYGVKVKASDQQTFRTLRRGRPKASEAGLVDALLMDAATALFLEQGFGRTTLDQVAKHARVGKSALYSRYRSKEALFEDVVLRSIQLMFSEMTPVSSELDVEDRLRHVGNALAEGFKLPRCIAFMRMVAAEADNFPQLAEHAYASSFRGAVDGVAVALRGTKGLDACGEGRAEKAATRFVEVALQPLSFQATFGTDPQQIYARAEEMIEDAILLLKVRGDVPQQ